MKRVDGADEQGRAWQEHQDAQRRAWLTLTPVQRLRWLAQAKDFCRKALAARREDKTSNRRK